MAILSTILDLKTFKKREADLLIILRSAIFSIGSINVSKYQAIVCLFLQHLHKIDPEIIYDRMYYMTGRILSWIL